MIKADATNIAKIKVVGIGWYVRHYTPSMEQQKIRHKQNLSEIPTELQYVEGSVFMKEVKTQSFWGFELVSREGINVPSLNIVGFQQGGRQNA